MMAALALAIILLLYYLTFRYLRQQRYPQLFMVVLFAMAGYDWLFIQASYILPGVVVGFFKLYFEYLALFLAIGTVAKDRSLTIYNSTFRPLLLQVLLPSLLIVLIKDLWSPHPFSGLLTSLRLFGLPVLLLFLMFRAGIFRKIKPAFVLNSIIAASVVFLIAGVFQRLSYGGDVRDLWFYKFFDRFQPNPVWVGQANYIRNNDLRVTGIFVSPITQTIALGIGVLLLAAKLLFQNGTRGRRIFLSVLLLALVYGQWRTHTRVGLIMDALGVAVMLGSRLWPRRAGWLYLVPVAAVGATFASLLSGSVQEASALGRLVQFQKLAELFRPLGLGFSDPLTDTHFDSYLISLLLLYGLLAVFPILFLWQLNRSVIQLLRTAPRSVFLNATLAVCSSFVYLFTFQYIAGSWPYRVYFLLLFYCWFAYDQYLKAKVCPAAADGLVPTNDF